MNLTHGMKRGRGRPTSKVPPTGSQLRERDRLIAVYGSLHAAGLVAGCSENTLRRWLYETPGSIDLRTERALARVGVTRASLGLL
jgi:hypothetical protein